MKLFSLIFLFLGMVANMFATVPEGRLFQFERSKNRNYICYDVNQSNGHLDMNNPVHAYWIRAEEDGAKKELSFVQRKMAFGYKVEKKGNNEVTIHLTAYDKLQIRVCRRNDKWEALCNLNGKQMRITKMFAQMRSPNSLHVEYVDIYGIDLSTGKAVRERINNSAK